MWRKFLTLPKPAQFPKIFMDMRTDLDHLPPAKQRELERIVEVIFDEFRAATENATGSRKGARILKMVLFGSYARGDWVDAPLSANQYKSDYDILVIVSQKEMTDRATYWTNSEGPELRRNDSAKESTMWQMGTPPLRRRLPALVLGVRPSEYRTA